MASSSNKTQISDLLSWIEYNDKSYFMKVVRQLHKLRLIEMSINEMVLEILPPGMTHVEKIIAKLK